MEERDNVEGWGRMEGAGKDGEGSGEQYLLTSVRIKRISIEIFYGGGWGLCVCGGGGEKGWD